MGREEHDFGQKVTALDMLDAVSRTRSLTQSETLRLDRALRRSGHAKGQRRWSTADILRLRRHLLNGKRPTQIAVLMKGRSERAIWRMMTRLGWTVQDAQLWVINPSEPISWDASDNYSRPERKAVTVQTNDRRRRGRNG